MTDAISGSGSNVISNAGSNISSNAGLKPGKPVDKAAEREEVRAAFQKAMGDTFYRQLLKTMRDSTSKAAYMHGGQAEDIFQAQLDEILIERMSEANGGDFSDRMFEQQFPHLRQAPAKKDAAKEDAAKPGTPAAVSGATEPSSVAKPDGVSKPVPPAVVNPADVIRRLDQETRRDDAIGQKRAGENMSRFSYDA